MKSNLLLICPLFPATMARNVKILVVACPGGKEAERIVSREVIDALGKKEHLKRSKARAGAQSTQFCPLPNPAALQVSPCPTRSAQGRESALLAA